MRQFQVPPGAAAHAAASQIARTTRTDAQAAGIVPGIRQAVVVSWDGGTPPTCTVTFDGTTNVAGIRYQAPYFAAPGDLVNCIVTAGGAAWILGDLAPAARSPVEATIGSSEGTTSAAYTDLATPGPAATIYLKDNQPALVTVSTVVWANQSGTFVYAGYAVSGAESQSPDDADAAYLKLPTNTQNDMMVTRSSVYQAGTAGNHTFTMKYKSNGTNNPQFGNRRIIVTPYI